MSLCTTGSFLPSLFGGSNIIWIIAIALFLFSNPCFKSNNLIWIIILGVFLFSRCGGGLGSLGNLFGPAPCC